jgi:hypothetical protein
MKGVQADLLVWDESHHVMTHSRTMSARYGDILRGIDGVSRVVPVLNDTLDLAGQPQTVYAVPMGDFDISCLLKVSRKSSSMNCWHR